MSPSTPSCTGRTSISIHTRSPSGRSMPTPGRRPAGRSRRACSAGELGVRAVGAMFRRRRQTPFARSISTRRTCMRRNSRCGTPRMSAALRLQSSTRPVPSHTTAPRRGRRRPRGRSRSSAARDGTVGVVALEHLHVTRPNCRPPFCPLMRLPDRPERSIDPPQRMANTTVACTDRVWLPGMHRRAGGLLGRVAGVGQRHAARRLGDRPDLIDLDVGPARQLLGLGSGPLGGLGPGGGQQLAVVVDRERDALDPDVVARLVGGGVDDPAGLGSGRGCGRRRCWSPRSR